jgi:hypothetical protein
VTENRYRKIYDAISPMLAEIQDMWPEGRTKITLVIRFPRTENAEIILGDDTNYDDVIAVLEKYKTAAPRVEIGQQS